MTDTRTSISASPEAEVTTLPETWVEAAARWCGIGILALMLLIITIEVIMRAFFAHSWEGTVEFGGYLLVALTFASLPVTLTRGGFHQMQVVRIRLSPRTIVILDIFLDVLALSFMLVLVWQFARLELSSWESGDTSMTGLRTPLWVPRLSMVLGSVALCFTLIRFILNGVRKIQRVP